MYVTGPSLKQMFESKLKLLLHIPKLFNMIQVLKLFLFLLGVTVFACVANADVRKAIVALNLGKTTVSHIKEQTDHLHVYQGFLTLIFYLFEWLDHQ